MKKIITALLFSSILGCFLPNEEIKIIELNYGVCKTKKNIKFNSKNSPSGEYHVGIGLDLKKETDTIPAKVGVEFGISYEIQAKHLDNILIEKVWTFPEEIKNSKGEIFKELRTESELALGGKGFYTSYIFEKPHEVVKGVWKLEIFHKGRLLHQRNFLVL